MKKKLLIIGGGGHAKACIDVIELSEEYQILGIVDDKLTKGSKLLGYSILGADSDLPELLKMCPNVFLGVGQIKKYETRKAIVEKCLNLGARFPSIVSPLAHVSKHSSIGQGTIVMHRSMVQANSSIGDFCILNDCSLIEHDCNIGDYTHISTGAILNGNVSIGCETFIGSGAVIFQERRIGSNVIVGASSTIRNDVAQGEKIV